jgi:hypothetical protein
MKVLPNQPPKYIRLCRDEIELISKLLTQHAARLSKTKPPHARIARFMRGALPKSLPYELSVLPQEWEILSKALRPEGSNPHAQPGSDTARALALYQRLRKVCVFTTQGDLDRMKKAKNSYRRFAR